MGQIILIDENFEGKIGSKKINVGFKRFFLKSQISFVENIFWSKKILVRRNEFKK